MLKKISHNEDVRTSEDAVSLPAAPDHSPPAVVKPAARKRRGAKKFQAFEVSMWVTKLHDVEIGIYQHSRHEAKSRQFTKDMDLFGEIKSNGERIGLLGYRKELWQSHQGMDKRLVIKLFSPNMNWQATMDLMLGRSLQLTHGARGLPVTAFSINLDSHEQVVQIERSANKWPGMPESFSFFILEEGRPRFYRLKRDFISIGVDFTLFDEQDRKVAAIDGRVITLGGKWAITIDEDHAYPKLGMVLQLFCGMLKFNDEVRHHVEDLTSAMHRSKLVPKLEQTEADLYMNPRRVR